MEPVVHTDTLTHIYMDTPSAETRIVTNNLTHAQSKRHSRTHQLGYLMSQRWMQAVGAAWVVRAWVVDRSKCVRASGKLD